jgi:hypothetical protein
MKNRQIRLIMGILVGLVLFSSSLAFLFYSKQDSKIHSNEKNVEMYIASRHLNRGDMIHASDVEKVYLPKSYLSVPPLTQSELMGRYAAVEIFAKEPLRKEKLSLVKPQEKQVKKSIKKAEIVPEHKATQVNDTVTLSLNLFQNIDTSLKAGDYIDIVSVLPKSRKSKNMELETKYIALHVLINSFVSNTNKIETAIKKEGKNIARADSVVFEMSPKEIKNFFSTYYKTQELNANRVFNTARTNKGHLWMVKCSDEDNQKVQKLKDRLMVDYVAVQHKRAKRVERVSISYEK